MKVVRLWERKSDFFPDRQGVSGHKIPEIRETVKIDARSAVIAPTITELNHTIEGYISIHNLTEWGELIMTKGQAKVLTVRLIGKLYPGMVLAEF